MIHADCGFFTSSPNHYAVCGWRIADGYWSKRRRQERAETRELKRTEKLLAEAAPAGHVRKIKPRFLRVASLSARWYVRGALSRHVWPGDPFWSVEAVTDRLMHGHLYRFGLTEGEAMEVALAYADGRLHSPDPKPYPSPHPYGKDR